MTVADFDSSQYAKRLRDSGLPQPVADIEAETMGEMARFLAGLSAEAEKREVMAEAARREAGARIDTVAAVLHAKIDTVASELNSKIDTVAGELNSKIDARYSELNAKIDTVASELHAKIDARNSELNAKIDIMGSVLNAKIDTVGIVLNAKIDRVAAELRAQMASNQSEMIRWVVSVGILQFALVAALVLKLVH